jgi:hypothetical protein
LTVDVVTNHKDNKRSAVYSSETVLTPANVNSTNFGKVNFFAVDGKVDAQPLYLSSVSIGGVTRNVLYVVTEHGSAYAFDADSGAQLWKTSTIGFVVGETPSDDTGCPDAVTPEIGITSTPVIDRTRGPHGALYLVAMSKSPPPSPGASAVYYQRVHALDIATGAELFGGPQAVVASVPGTGSGGSSVSFDPFRYMERAGLLMVNGVVYTTWSSHCDQDPYWGWIIGFNAATLQQATVLNITPNGSRGGIWMAGSGPAADSAGTIYLIIGNGTFDETLNVNFFPVNANFGNAYLKLSTPNGLAVADYFTTFNTTSQSANDTDFGSGGALLLPDLVDSAGMTRHLAVGSGKDRNIYVVDRDSMGKFSSSANNNYQTVSGALAGGVFSKPAYFNGMLYYGAIGDHLKALPINNALVSSTPSSQTSTTFGYPGTTPSISANGSTNGIVWAVENNSTAAVLHAYNASNLALELYNSNQAPSGRDQFGPGNKFIAPIIANGRVYVGTRTGVAAFGLLP